MLSLTTRKLLCGCAVSAAVVLTGTTPAAAAPVPAPAAAWHQADDDPADDTARDNNDNDGDNGLWGLLGLVGLLGLAGLIRRDPKPGAMAGYPAAGSGAPGAPPANTYPPAEPRRTPPGA
jgi:MYXO-CTERM domain-containing protein